MELQTRYESALLQAVFRSNDRQWNLK